MSELNFMGYLLSTKRIGPTESRVWEVMNVKEPQNAGQVRSFLGLVNFSANFIPNFTTKTEPLWILTKKGQEFLWREEQQHAFDMLKRDLSQASTLAYFDLSAETTLITDVSPVALGAVLT